MTPREPAVTVLDVARAADVSSATVSRVLNGKASVDPELARRVTEAVAATGYVLNSTGRALRRQVSDVWAAIVSDLQNPFFTGVVGALEDVAVRQGFSVMLCNSDERLDRERRYVSATIAQRMSGTVIAVASERESDLRPLARAGMPVVLIDRRVHDYAGDSVLVDNRTAGRLAAEHLVAQGFRRVACIAGPADVTTTEDRLCGLRAQLVQSGGGLDERYVRRTDLRTDGGVAAARSLLAMADPPDAVFATNGPLTAGAYRAVQGLGLRMPSDVGLIGVDDDQWTRMVTPQVSVIAQPVQQIGRLAGELLDARSRDPAAPPRHEVLPPTLLERASSTALRG